MVRIETAQPLSGYRLKVRFNAGREGIYPVEPERRGGVFLNLLEAKNFKVGRVSLLRAGRTQTKDGAHGVTRPTHPEFGCGEWAGGIDLGPDTMPQAMTGSAADRERPSQMALREDAEKNR